MTKESKPKKNQLKPKTDGDDVDIFDILYTKTKALEWDQRISYPLALYVVAYTFLYKPEGFGEHEPKNELDAAMMLIYNFLLLKANPILLCTGKCIMIIVRFCKLEYVGPVLKIIFIFCMVYGTINIIQMTIAIYSHIMFDRSPEFICLSMYTFVVGSVYFFSVAFKIWVGGRDRALQRGARELGAP